MTPSLSFTRPCDSCILNDDDHSPKEGVKWCGVCQAWKCKRCRNNPKRSMIAFLRDKPKK